MLWVWSVKFLQNQQKIKSKIEESDIGSSETEIRLRESSASSFEVIEENEFEDLQLPVDHENLLWPKEVCYILYCTKLWTL